MTINNDNYYLQNPNLKRTGVKENYTKEQAKEYLKCKNDIIYFFKKYVKIVNVDKGMVAFEPYDYQKEMVKIFQRERFTLIKSARQSGKCILGSAEVNIRNKKTGEIKKIGIKNFFDKLK